LYAPGSEMVGPQAPLVPVPVILSCAQPTGWVLGYLLDHVGEGMGERGVAYCRTGRRRESATRAGQASQSGAGTRP
jgi:hypothetical protein